MLLSATVLRARIQEENDKPSKVIILIADSMAVNEGADKQKVVEIVKIYKRSLETHLALLNLKENAEILCSSTLEVEENFQELSAEMKQVPIMKMLERDTKHYQYIQTQTTITSYMERYKDVGGKIGWICEKSRKLLHQRGRIEFTSLKRWDELNFDLICQKVCPSSEMQYLYAKAGLEWGTDHKIREASPYAACGKGKRFLGDKKLCLKEISKLVRKQWSGTFKVCHSLCEIGVIQKEILPTEKVKKNDKANVVNLLNHWL